LQALWTIRTNETTIIAPAARYRQWEKGADSLAADSSRPGIFLEVPDFGFGPAATALAAIRQVIYQYDWTVVSTGNAAAFLRNELPSATHLELDTWKSSQWPAFNRLAPRKAIVISSGNPLFAEWAIGEGYRVGHLDALDWMWTEERRELTDAEFRIAQAYYGTLNRFSSETREIARPMVDVDIWSEQIGPAQSRTGLIAFGGMSLPGYEDLVTDYARWILTAGLRSLIEHYDCTRVAIVGGRSDLPWLVPPNWREHPRVQTLSRVSRRDYARLVRQSEYLLVSPGLATIYECYVSNTRPVYQPGFNYSMILQLRDLIAAGYSNAITWPWHKQFVNSIAGIPEVAGLQLLQAQISESIHDDVAGIQLSKTLSERNDWSEECNPSALANLWSLPDSATLVAHHLQRLTG